MRCCAPGVRADPQGRAGARGVGAQLGRAAAKKDGPLQALNVTSIASWVRTLTEGGCEGGRTTTGPAEASL